MTFLSFLYTKKDKGKYDMMPKGRCLKVTTRVFARRRRKEMRQKRRRAMTRADEAGVMRSSRGLAAPGSWKRQGGPSLGASAGSSALGHHDHLRTVSRAGGGWMSVVFSHPFGVLSYSCPRTLV